MPARHPECNFGEPLLRYLITGDNQGQPWLDQRFGADVGTPLPQARALVDDTIESCDAYRDREAERTAGEASASAAATRTQQAQAEEGHARESNCAAIGGRYDTRWGWCASTVIGNPSGKAGADCSNASVAFDGVAIDQASVRRAGEWYPGCFPA